MILKIVLKSLRQHALSTTVTALAIALAAGLVMSVFSIQRQTYAAFAGGETGFDAVLGARGSQLQLVLNTVFHLETSPGNIPYTMYREIANDPQVELAIPYAVGDNYQGFRIVGTSDEIFTRFEYRRSKKFEVEANGRFFDPNAKEAVVGSYVANETKLKVGDVIQPYHGLVYNEKNRHNDDYTVVGILKPTNSPSDRVIWIPLEGIYRMEGHIAKNNDVYNDQPIPDEAKEVSAVMLKLRSPQAGMNLDQLINRQGKAATLAFPIGRVMAELFDKVGWLNRVIELIAYLVVFVAAFSVLASIYNSLNERRREFAILRALGAGRNKVFSVIIFEAAAISLLGSLLGFAVFAVIISITAYVVREQTGVVLDIFRFDTIFIFTPVLMVIIGAAAGLIPAIKAYRTDIASNLTPAS